MKEIELTQGKVALVDDEDYEYLSQTKWWASKIHNTWYAMRAIYLGRVNGCKKYKTILMHRVVAERAGMDMSHQIDHKDHNGLNNQQDNLRPATNKQNQENKPPQKNNTSGYKGIGWVKHKNMWRARIYHNGKEKYLGYFDKKEEAIKARHNAEKKYFTHSEACS